MYFDLRVAKNREEATAEGGDVLPAEPAPTVL
jgi:hypothetical protein